MMLSEHVFSYKNIQSSILKFCWALPPFLFFLTFLISRAIYNMWETSIKKPTPPPKKNPSENNKKLFCARENMFL